LTLSRTLPPKLVDRLADVLAQDVPEGDIDGREGGAQDGALEVGVARDHLEVVLDPARVLADEVLAQLGDGVVDELVVRPQAGLAGPDDARVGVDAHEQAPVDEKRLDPFDLHGTASRWRLAGQDRRGRSTAQLAFAASGVSYRPGRAPSTTGPVTLTAASHRRPTRAAEVSSQH